MSIEQKELNSNRTLTEEIVSSIFETLKPVSTVSTLADNQGIYAFAVIETNDLGKFGSSGQIIYSGLSANLNGRDLGQHLTSGQTGWSTLRRSIGAILKTQLNLTAIKRDKNSTKLRADKYKFEDEGEELLTQWMKNNLKIGYWSNETSLKKNELEDEEEKVIIRLKPTLDLDRRTKKYNPLAEDLDVLRKICREEVRKNNAKL